MKRVTLIQSERSGIFVLPDDLTFDQVTGLYADGCTLSKYNYRILDDNTSVDIETYRPTQYEFITADVQEDEA